MYGFDIKLTGDMDQAVARVTEALAKAHLGVLTKVDVQAVFKAKLNLDRRPYLILGACAPDLARQMIDAEPDVGLLMPCNVVVQQEEDESIRVSFMDPVKVFGISENPALESVNQDARARMERARNQLMSE
jgi:uncharacterized protein (DUF302 family)